jgi:hypothetical protein
LNKSIIEVENPQFSPEKNLVFSTCTEKDSVCYSTQIIPMFRYFKNVPTISLSSPLYSLLLHRKDGLPEIKIRKFLY